MHAISSYRGNRHKNTNKPTNTQTGPITIHCAAASTQCNNHETSNSSRLTAITNESSRIPVTSHDIGHTASCQLTVKFAVPVIWMGDNRWGWVLQHGSTETDTLQWKPSQYKPRCLPSASEPPSASMQSPLSACQTKSCSPGFRALIHTHTHHTPNYRSLFYSSFLHLILRKPRPKISKFDHVTQATPTYGSFYGPHAGGVRPRCPYQIWIGYLFLQKLLGGPKLGNYVTWPGPRPLRGCFIIGTQGGSILYVCTKFEADSSIRSKVIRGVPKFRNHVTLSHAPFEP